MVKLNKETKALMADFLDSLRDYMHESHNLLCFDERESDDFVDIYEKQLNDKERVGRHLATPDVINSTFLEELLSKQKEIVCSPKRDVVISADDVKKVFEKRGIKWTPPF